MRKAARFAFSAILPLAILLSPAAAARAAGSPDPVDLETVLEMVEAGVGEAIILKQVAAAGPGFSVGVPEVLELKRAGASDGLIDGLMELAGILPRDQDRLQDAAAAAAPSPPAPALSEPPENFRIYRETDGEGREVIHITNLDAAGQRLGGPPPGDGVPAPRNAYVSRSDDPGYREQAGSHVEPSPGAGGRIAPPQVVVNVFQPQEEPVAVYEDDRYRDPYGRRYVSGYLPGLHGRHRGHGHGHAFGVPSPPGSYSHFKRYHAGGSFGHTGLHHGGLAHHRATQFGRVRAFAGHARPVPFHTAGAGILNGMRAGVKLGH